MTDGEKSMTSFFGLFRKKVDDVLEHASCPVAIFVNRDYRNGDEVAVLIMEVWIVFFSLMCVVYWKMEGVLFIYIISAVEVKNM